MQFRTTLFSLAIASLAISVLLPSAALASPWAEVGNNQLRSDIELLASARVIDGITIQWPLPWRSLQQRLRSTSLECLPASVQAAANRVLAAAAEGTEGGIRAALVADATNLPSVIYGFDGMGHGDAQAQLVLAANSGIFSGRLALGAITRDFGGKPNKLMPDGTFLSARLGGVRIYAGYLDHWWGPGEISTLQLSNNARPMPQIGIERSSNRASSWPVLKWLGPWQAEFFLGKLDGPQIQSNVYFNGLHVSLNPLPGLEIGLAKTEEFCGQGTPCSPLRDYFTNIDLSTHPNRVNGEGSVEVKYSGNLAGLPLRIYAQLMNEDYSFFNHSGTSHLFGIGTFVPIGANPLKLTAEFSDSIATLKPFSFGNYEYGYTYNNGEFADGMRYRGRTIGFSLDNDSVLMSMQASWTDPANRFYQISLHHAEIGNNRSIGANIVSKLPVKLNMAELKFSLPFAGRGLRLDLAGRVQDDRPRPERGFAASVEAALKVDL